MEGGGWRVEGGGWRVEGGGWRVEGEGWRVVGVWRVEGGVLKCRSPQHDLAGQKLDGDVSAPSEEHTRPNEPEGARFHLLVEFVLQRKSLGKGWLRLI